MSTVYASADVDLSIGGFVPFSTADYPGRLAAVVFCQGCPWRCRYCHNPHLQRPYAHHEWTWPRVRGWLDRRRGLIDAVVFSGGEPTAQAALEPALACARTMGFDIGLHTAGIYPRRLARLLHRVHWVGLDIKAPVNAYQQVTSIDGSGSPAFECLDLLLASDVAFEVRTTVHPELTPPRALSALARALADRGVRRWTLQRFRAQGCSDASLAQDDAYVTADLIASLAAHVPEIATR